MQGLFGILKRNLHRHVFYRYGSTIYHSDIAGYFKYQTSCYLQLVAVHLQQLLSVNVSRVELWDILVHVNPSQPITDLLTRPGGGGTGSILRRLGGGAHSSLDYWDTEGEVK